MINKTALEIGTVAKVLNKRKIDPTSRIIGERIDKVRRKHDDTIRELADYLNLSESFMRAIMKGRRRASPEYLIRIADRYDVSLDYLHGRTDREEMVWEDEQLSVLLRVTADMNEDDLDKAIAIVKIMKGEYSRTDCEIPGGGNNRWAR